MLGGRPGGHQGREGFPRQVGRQKHTPPGPAASRPPRPSGRGERAARAPVRAARRARPPLRTLSCFDKDRRPSITASDIIRHGPRGAAARRPAPRPARCQSPGQLRAASSELRRRGTWLREARQADSATADLSAPPANTGKHVSRQLMGGTCGSRAAPATGTGGHGCFPAREPRALQPCWRRVCREHVAVLERGRGPGALHWEGGGGECTEARRSTAMPAAPASSHCGRL